MLNQYDFTCKVANSTNSFTALPNISLHLATCWPPLARPVREKARRKREKQRETERETETEMEGEGEEVT